MRYIHNGDRVHIFQSGNNFFKYFAPYGVVRYVGLNVVAYSLASRTKVCVVIGRDKRYTLGSDSIFIWRDYDPLGHEFDMRGGRYSRGFQRSSFTRQDF